MVSSPMPNTKSLFWKGLLALPVLFACTVGQAQTVQNGNRIIMNPSLGGTQCLLAVCIGRDLVNVVNFGAVPDSQGTDSTAAINSAIDAIRLNRGVGGAGPYGQPLGALYLGNGRFDVTSINLTGFANNSLTFGGIDIICDGCQIMCSGSGNVCIDTAGSRYLRFHGLTVNGSATSPPKIGVQVGRIAPGETAQKHMFYDLMVNGTFTFTPFYNFASEETTIYGCVLQNDSTSSTSYILVADGANHWGITSAYATITSPVDTQESFINFRLYGCHFRRADSSTATGSAIWIENTRNMHIQGYAINAALTAPAIVLYFQSGDTIANLSLDLHIEGNQPYTGPTFDITGTVVQPTISGLRYEDSTNQTTTSVFSRSGSVYSVTIDDLEIEIPEFLSTPTLFDTPARYTASGKVSMPNSASWNGGAIFSGLLCLDTQCAVNLNNGSTSTPRNRNGMFSSGTDIISWATAGVMRGSVTAGGTWEVGNSNAAKTNNNGTAIPIFQVQDASVTGRTGTGTFAYNTNSLLPAYTSGNKSHNATLGTNTIVLNGESLHSWSAQGNDGFNFQPSSEILGLVGAAPSSGASASSVSSVAIATTGTPPVEIGGTGYTPGSFTVTAAGGTCSTQPTFTATANASGVVTSISSLESGICSSTPAAINTPTGGTGSGLQISIGYTAMGTPGVIPGELSFKTGGATLAAVLLNTSVAPGGGGSGYAASGSFTATVPGGTCSVQPQFTVTTNGSGQVNGVTALVTAGACTAPPSNPITVTGGAGTGARLAVMYTSLTEAIKIDSAQQITLTNIATTPGGKGFACIDEATGKLYKSNAGAC